MAVKSLTDSDKKDFSRILNSLSDSKNDEQKSRDIFHKFYNMNGRDMQCLIGICKKRLEDGDILEYKNNLFLWDLYGLVPIKNNFMHDCVHIEQLFIDKYGEDHFTFL